MSGHMGLTSPPRRLSHSTLPMPGIKHWMRSTLVRVKYNLVFVSPLTLLKGTSRL